MWKKVPIENQWKTANIISFILLLLYPSLKTAIALKTKKNRGHWSQYWIGIGFLLPIYFIISNIICNFPKSFVIVSIFLIYRNGFFVQQFTLYVVTPIFCHFFDEFDILALKFLEYVKKIVSDLLDHIMAIIRTHSSNNILKFQ